jgi:hypothetical protein
MCCGVVTSSFISYHPCTGEGMFMTRTRLGIQVSEDQQTVLLEISPEGETRSPVELNLDQLSKLITLLGHTRQRMIQGLPMQTLEGMSVETVYRPNWYIQVAKIDGSLLAFDHPAFGAVGFAIPREEVADIVKILKGHLLLPEGSGKRN